ncbi:flagellar protein FliO/FliZ [Alkalibacillus filiformis]|uniref:Flagellar protein FliO/FliZ n=1 Tax=Alkalibacillus filiformis TaxID=200990 RepID=A0ABU0DQA6_9BACI|nr:flagellar biosynthetic protein FliO [Alkalibacillus filiformis]MDQ0350633.1 flagellar protein FliO/FliZ [Alkalibacillus filiformis]
MKLLRILLVSILFITLFSSYEEITFANEECDGSVSDCLEEFDSGVTNDGSDEQQEEESPPAVTNNEQSEEQMGQSNRSLFLDFLRMIAALVLVLALIFVVLKFVQKRTRIYQQTQSLENVGGIALGNNKSAQVVRVGNEYYLLGVGDNVEMLTKVEDEATIEQLSQSHEESSSNISFQSVLQNFQNRNRNPYQEQETKNQFKTELETMKNSRKRMMKRYQDKDGTKDE